MTSEKEGNIPMSPEEYAKMHQKAFRTAYNYLNTHFPPGIDPEWWSQAAKDLSDASVEAGETELVIELLDAVYTYIGKVYKRRNEHGTDD